MEIESEQESAGKDCFGVLPYMLYVLWIQVKEEDCKRDVDLFDKRKLTVSNMSRSRNELHWCSSLAFCVGTAKDKNFGRGICMHLRLYLVTDLSFF